MSITKSNHVLSRLYLTHNHRKVVSHVRLILKIYFCSLEFNFDKFPM